MSQVLQEGPHAFPFPKVNTTFSTDSESDDDDDVYIEDEQQELDSSPASTCGDINIQEEKKEEEPDLSTPLALNRTESTMSSDTITADAARNASSRKEVDSITFIQKVTEEIQQVKKNGQMVMYIVGLQKKIQALENDKIRLKKSSTKYRLKENMQKNEENYTMKLLQKERDEYLHKYEQEQTKVESLEQDLERATLTRSFDEDQEEKAEKSRHRETLELLENLRLEHALLEETCESNKTTMGRLETEKAGLQSQLAEKENQLETMKEQHSRQLEEQAAADSSRKEAESLQDRLDDLQLKHSALRLKFEKQTEDLEQVQKDNAGLEAQLQTMVEMSFEMGATPETEEGKDTPQETIADALQQQEEQHKAALDQLQSEHLEAIQRLETQHTAALESAQSESKTTIQSLQEENALLHMEVGNYMVNLENQGSKCVSMASASEDWMDQKTKYQEKISHLEEQVQNLTTSNQQQERAIMLLSKSTAKLGEFEKESERLATKYLEQENALLRMQEQVNQTDTKSKNRLQTISVLLKESEAENRKLKAKCAALEESLSGVFHVDGPQSSFASPIPSRKGSLNLKGEESASPSPTGRRLSFFRRQPQ